MSHDYTQQPEFAGPATAVSFLSTGLRFPESLGPSSETGQDYGSPGLARIGQPPPLMPPELRDRERAGFARRHALRQQVEAAALEAAGNAMLAQNLSAQLLADVDRAVERAVAAAPPPEVPAEVGRNPAAPEPEEVPAS